ncbi:MAG TPA: hybrid sensor histidine kinase/response regulator [Cytophagaceae bacterium]|jgi:hypothetical protein
MEKDYKILILEDVEEDAYLIERVLRKEGMKFITQRVDTENEYTQAIQNFHPDIVLSDHTLPQFNSYKALKISKTYIPDAPFILVTGTVSEEFAVNCLKDGADDYVLKSNLARLPSAILSALKQKRGEAEKGEVLERLNVQNLELIKINKELDRFVYSASHELRAPLTSILGLVDLAQMECTDVRIQEYLSYMKKSIHKLEETVVKIKEHSRNARTELKWEKIDPTSFIDEILDLLKFMEGASNIERRVNIKQDCDLYCDKFRLKVIISNLISNAIKYYNPKVSNPFISINVTITKETSEFAIADNGIGIVEEFIDKVFDMFFRGTEQSVGTGLGLFIVGEKIETLNGTIDLKSIFGQGSTFTVRIPNGIDIN